MEIDKKLPNGFSNWQETHFEIVCAIAIELNKDTFDSKVIADRHEAQGRGGIYELAEELTDEFEAKNEGREWDGEYFDEIDLFIKEKLYS